MTQANAPVADNSIGVARALSLAVIAMMLALALNIVVQDGFGHGAGMDTFNAGAANPWQLFINMDLMAGLLLMLGWIIWREKGEAPLRIVAWTLLILWWGNIAVASYILSSFVLSAGRADMLLAGRRVGQPVAMGKVGTYASAICLIGAALSAFVMLRGLISVRFAGLPAFGYAAAFGTLAFAFAVFAATSPRRKPA